MSEVSVNSLTLRNNVVAFKRIAKSSDYVILLCIYWIAAMIVLPGMKFNFAVMKQWSNG